MSTGAVRALLDTLVDDAAIFPPGNLPLAPAIREHRGHRTAWYSDLVGPFLVSDSRLAELGRLLSDRELSAEPPLAVSLVVTGGAGALEPALTWAERDERVRLRSVEIALRDEDDLARNAHRVTLVLAGTLPADVTAYVELPHDRTASWGAAADAVAEAGHRLKFRTGGETAEAHPDPAELAHSLVAALDRELAFKCTAGLHHAVRNTAPATGFEQHGFLNVALATRAVLDGAGVDEVVRVLTDRNAVSVASAAADLDAEAAGRIRSWFTSFGSCSIAEPVTDLVELGLLSRDPAGVAS